MTDMDRRDFMLAILGGAGLLGASGIIGGSTAFAALAPEALAQVYTRRNVYCLRATSPEIVAYKAAITAMKALPATNPTSWLAQANIHGAFTPPPGMIANVCRHDTLFFLAWHRMYLYFFERIVREKSGDPNFALPYWAYSPTGRRDLPALFRTPATAANPLYTANRNAGINAGGSMSPSQVDAGIALAQMTFSGLTNSINGTPHGAVHMAVGGGMSAFETAGQDPIFWLHHCNIDRLWEIWLASGGGRANPTTNTTWMTTSFDFYDETGATVPLTGEQIVDIVCQLRYQYESDVCGRIIVFDKPWWRRYSRLRIPPEILVARLDTIPPRPPLPDPPPPLALLQETIRLGGRPTRVALPIPEEARRLLTGLRDERGAGSVDLVLEDVRLEGRARVFYEIYIGLPADTANPVYTSPHYAGNLNLFGPSPRGAHTEKAEPQIVPLSLLFRRLREANLWQEDSLRVTFVPRPIIEGGDPATILGQATQATIGRMSLQMR